MRGGAPTRLEELLRSSPEMRERVIEARLRREWQGLVGVEMAGQAQPISLHRGVLTVGVASSPWLHQLTLLSGELHERLDRAVGPGIIQELRFQIHALAEYPAPPSSHRPERVLTPQDVHAIDQALTPIRDPALGAVLKRLMLKARLNQPEPSGTGASLT